MIHDRLIPALFSFSAAIAFATPAHISENLLPSPHAARDADGALDPAFTATLVAPGLPDDTPALRVLKETFAVGRRIPVTLALEAKSGIKAEGYRLVVTPEGATLTASDSAGLFYGAQTLRQLAALDRKGIPAGVIDDAPAFAIRGFMHDTGRNFRTVAALKADLDKFAEYKLNTFHWHLTDNPAWRIECKAYPQLNDVKFRKPGRDPEATYSYDDIRDVIRYAKARHIRIIPELDMPGHSEYFKNAFGFTMGDKRALPILEKLLEEFCAEIPREDCPILHIGSDEVHVADPKTFIDRITAKVEALGRTPVIWNPGLKNNGRCIAQLWREPDSGAIASDANAGFVDSGLGYLNSLQPQQTVRKYFFRRTCGVAAGDAKRLGGILCLWPDARVDDKTKIAAQNGQWPGVLAFSENTWSGRPEFPAAYGERLPVDDTAALASFAAFESTVAIHRDTFFKGLSFPFVKSSALSWKVIGPFVPAKDGKMPGATPETEIRAEYTGLSGRKLAWQAMRGGALLLPTTGKESVHTGAEGGMAYALTYVKSETARTLHARIGFESPARSNRQSGGIPKPGEWSAFGAGVFLNDVPVPAPVWKNPGKHFEPKPTWFSPANEQPFEDEELYWTREPDALPLKAGWNKVLIRIPAKHFAYGWGFAFLPVVQNADGRWVEDESVVVSAKPE